MLSLLNLAYFLTCFATLADSASLVRLGLATREMDGFSAFSKVVLKAREEQRVGRIRVWMNEVLKIIPLLEKSTTQYQIMLCVNFCFFICWKQGCFFCYPLDSKCIGQRGPNSDNMLWKPSELSNSKKGIVEYNKYGEEKRIQNIVFYKNKW